MWSIILDNKNLVSILHDTITSYKIIVSSASSYSLDRIAWARNVQSRGRLQTLQTSHKVKKMLPSAILCAFFVAVNSVPVVYDQRQDGKLNVYAGLENIAIVFFTNEKSSSLPDSIGASLLQQILEARQKAQTEIEPSYKFEDASLNKKEEPYRVEILKLGAEHEMRSSTAEAGIGASKPVLIQENAKSVSLPAGDDITRRKPLKDSATTDIKPIQRTQRADDVKVDKKQQNTKEDFAYYKPIGDAIENCGPGRVRNSDLICEDDKTQKFEKWTN